MSKSNVKGPIRLAPYDEKYLDATLQFLGRLNPDHPELGGKDLFLWQKCSRFLAIFKNNIVGHMAIIEQPFWSSAGRFTAGWGSALVLDTANFALKTFAGVALLDKCLDDFSYVYFGVGIVPEIEQSYLRKGYVICRNSVRMFARFFRPPKALKYYEKPRILSLPIMTMNILRPAARFSDHLEHLTAFEEGTDALWAKLQKEQYNVYGERTASFLNYKISQPAKDYAILIHSQADEPDGYMIFRRARHNTKELDIIKICDFVGSEVAKIRMICEVLRIADETGVDGVVALSSSRDKAIFNRAGMWLSIKYPIGLKPNFAGKMHLTFFDSDLDNLW